MDSRRLAVRIVVTGAAGQFGRRFVRAAKAEHDVVPFVRRPDRDGADRVVVDVTDGASVRKAVSAAAPDWVVHAAAMTDVDACEADPEAARRVNVEGARNVATATQEAGGRLVYVSTDYVFDGAKGGYDEGDATSPVNAYGRSKEAGEAAVRDVASDAIVARTSVLFGPDGNNYVTWLISAMAAGKTVRVVEDQRVSPTYTDDLSRQLLALMIADQKGIFHTAGADALTRLEMAWGVSTVFGFDRSLIVPVSKEEMDWVAPRPSDTSLDVSKVSQYAEPLAYVNALRAFAEVRAA